VHNKAFFPALDAQIIHVIFSNVQISRRRSTGGGKSPVLFLVLNKLMFQGHLDQVNRISYAQLSHNVLPVNTNSLITYK